LKAWAESLGGIDYPLLSDFYPHGKITNSYGVLRTEGYPERAIIVIDKLGIIRYIDVHNIDEQPDNEELFKVLESIEGSSGFLYKRIEEYKKEEEIAESAPEADVILYCTSWCPQCRQARRYLQEKGIEFVEIDLSRNAAAARQVREWTGGYETTPTFKIYGEVVVNFQRPKLDDLLDRQIEK
jgi:glutaredoxin